MADETKKPETNVVPMPQGKAWLTGVKKAGASLGGPGPSGNWGLDPYLTWADQGDMFAPNLPGLTTPDDIIGPKALEFEDEFRGLYGLNAWRAGLSIIEPPFNKLVLEDACERNNALKPCIEAMMTNVDGTGWVVEPKDIEDAKAKAEGLAQDTKVKQLTEFFNEPWLGQSFTTQRKLLRYDLERTGESFLEVIRNPKDEVVFLRPVDGKTIRLIELDRGFYVVKEITRGGVTVTAPVHVRRRRYVQKVGAFYTFFKEFGAERDLDMRTGSWAFEGQRFNMQMRATELIHFMIDKDPRTPYGIPRWSVQMPSVLGSRKAEETNLAYFDAGGVPPALILVQGGTLAPKSAQVIDNFMSANPKAKTRAGVVEVVGGGMTDGKPNPVKIDVVSFGSERQQDSMFEKYDERCEERVRRSFRLPPMFVGQAKDYNYATAYASYIVAEAQVFQPERDEFDEMINLTIMREFDPDQKYRYRSLPLGISDNKDQYLAIAGALESGSITHESFIEAINEIMSLSLTMKPGVDDMQAENDQTQAALLNANLAATHASAAALNATNPENPGKAPETGGGSTPNKAPSSKSDMALDALAKDMIELVQKKDYGIAFTRAMQDIGSLGFEEMQKFRALIAKACVGVDMLVPGSTAELIAAAMHALKNR